MDLDGRIEVGKLEIEVKKEIGVSVHLPVPPPVPAV